MLRRIVIIPVSGIWFTLFGSGDCCLPSLFDPRGGVDVNTRVFLYRRPAIVSSAVSMLSALPGNNLMYLILYSGSSARRR